MSTRAKSGGWGLGSWIGLFAIVVFFICLVKGALSTPTASDSRGSSERVTQPAKPRDQGEDAYYFARRTAQAALKSPSSAKFSNPRTDQNTGWQADGYLQWRTFGTVDAKNPLGVELREKWQAVVQVNTGRMEVVYLKVGQEESGKIPSMRRAPGS